MNYCLKHAGKVLLAGFLILAIGWMLYPQSGLADNPPPEKMFVGSETCLECHDDVGESFPMSAHAILLKDSDLYKERLCEACHGPGSVHVDDNEPSSIINPAKLQGLGVADPCLECHGDSKYADWDFSSHATSDMHCADCHSAHARPGESLVKESPQLCYDCHTDVMASFYMPSHHPVSEGIVSCQDCHQIHGGDMKFAVENEGRHQCLSCHPDQEGPFIFEHAPVNEDCGICHTPHGSVANNLLVQSEPTLCLDCHGMHFHATIPGIEDDEIESPQQPGRFLSSTHDSFKSAFLTKCTQCHTEIHGSDLPSQSISGGGSALTR